MKEILNLLLNHSSIGECVANEDCPSDQACADFRCVDPCAQSCGQGADCDVNNHVAICRCPRGRTGDPFRVRQNRQRDAIPAKFKFNFLSSSSHSSPAAPSPGKRFARSAVPTQTAESATTIPSHPYVPARAVSTI